MIINFEDVKLAYEEKKDDELLAQYDDLINFLGALLEEEDRAPAVINPEKIKTMETAFRMLSSLTSDDESVNIECHLNEPYKSSGYISIEAKDLTFYDTGLLARALSLGNNVEVYPLTNGNIKMNLGFHGLTS